MSRRSYIVADRYWGLGGRWVDDAKHLSWPRLLPTLSGSTGERRGTEPA